MTSTSTKPQTEGFRHEAVFYAGAAEFVRAVTPFVREGVAAGEPVLVVVSAPKIAALRDALGADADLVEFADMAVVGRNPARIIPAWVAFVERHAGARALRGVGEPIDDHRSAAELVECQRHEALLNLAFADGPAFRLQCPYDVASLPEPVIGEARRTHPFVARGQDARISLDFDERDDPAGFADPLPPPPVDAESMTFRDGWLSLVREFVSHRAGQARLSAGKASDLVLAVNELATNSLRYGGGRGIVRVWEDDRGLVCEVTDSGTFSDPLIGRERPGPARLGGRGLWMVNQLCDLVQIRSVETGTQVRVFSSRD